MSWSVSAIGKSQAVAAAIEKQFTSSGACAEPEETVRQAARALIAQALSSEDASAVVSVSANGSQSSTYTDGKWGPPYTNQLKIEIQPQYGFVE